MLRIKFFFVILLSVLFFKNSYSQKLTSIAVLDFISTGINDIETMTLSERFRGEIVKTNSYVVMTKEKMNAVVEANANELSECNSLECIIRLGKVLQVDKIVQGKITKLNNNLYLIDVNIINLRSEQIERSFNRNYQGEFNGLFPILKELAIEIIPDLPGISKLPLYASGMLTISAAGLCGYSIYKAQNSYNHYQDALVGEDVLKYKEDTENYDNLSLISGITAGVTTIFYFIYNHYYKKSKKPIGLYATPQINKNNTYSLAINLNF